ncbi:lipoprotein Spr [Pedobacter sp. UYP30]|uniref:C40 family peptidase n=1 Tax=Pedobacter sp. UYP30 TaxID=1756400 RepID=UPI003393D47A
MRKLFIVVFLIFLSASAVHAQMQLPFEYQQVVKKLISEFGKKSTTHYTEDPAEVSSSTLIDFAKKLIGIPYRYATSNPNVGFDCSGFVNYVFSNFGFNVPRSSTEFANTGNETSLKECKVGDVLVFTGSNPKIRQIGHVGIVYSVDGDKISFIHATSGKAHGVTITELNDYYKSRFLKVMRIL